jgi:aspartate kinase
MSLVPSIIVQKYGGSSVATPEKIKRVALRIARAREAGHAVCVVVSAMGDTTDELLALARQVTERPERRELDMLLTAGERISMALLGLALNDLGVPAISFTGSQSGIITNDAHANARIVEVRPVRIQDELERGKVVIVAGYQGISYRKEVTTLGRGGSDTTAVALAAALSATYCEICSDVDGVYSADPRVVPEAVKLAELSYDEMQSLAEAGAKVLNAQAVEFAKAKGIAIYAKATFVDGPGTVVRGEALRRLDPPPQPGRIQAVTSESDVVLLRLSEATAAELATLLGLCDRHAVASREVSFSSGLATVLVSLENAHLLRAAMAELAERFGARLSLEEGLATVTCVGAGCNATHDHLRQAMELLERAGIAVHGLTTSSSVIGFVVPKARAADAVRALHAGFVGSGTQAA